MDRLVAKINKLIIHISNGDNEALEELFFLTRRMTLFMARKYLYDKSYAEDLLSETYYKIVKYSPTFDSSQNGLNWIYKIVHNEAINYNLKNKHRCECELIENNLSISYIDELLDQILVYNAIQTLTSEEKYIIYLRYWAGLDLQAIAEKINKPLTTTYDFLKRILKKLHKAMK